MKFEDFSFFVFFCAVFLFLFFTTNEIRFFKSGKMNNFSIQYNSGKATDCVSWYGHSFQARQSIVKGNCLIPLEYWRYCIFSNLHFNLRFKES